MGSSGVGLAFIAAGILLNLLFPVNQPDQTGTRLDSLDISGSAYGKPRNLSWGTVRLNGNIFYGPPKKEVINSEDVGENIFGKGGSTITTYSYFATFAIGFGEGVSSHLLKIWANDKLIWDATTANESGAHAPNSKYQVTFYTGSETQLPDPDIEAAVGVGNTPAYRGETYFVAKDWPLKDFGNGVPNITAEITFNGQAETPVDFFDITDTNIVPGSTLQADTGEFIIIDPFTNEVITFAEQSSGYLNRSSDASTLEVTSEDSWFRGGNNFLGSFHPPIHDDIVYTRFGNPTDSVGADNKTTKVKHNVRSGAKLHTWNYDFQGRPGHLRLGSFESGVGVVDLAIFCNATGWQVFLDGTATNNGMIPIDVEAVGQGPADIVESDLILHDPFTKRVFLLFRTATAFRLYEFRGWVVIDELGVTKGQPIIVQQGSDIAITTMFPSGTAAAIGYCFLPNDEAVIISNGDGSMAKFTLDDFSLQATSVETSFTTIAQWSVSNRFAFADTSYNHNATTAKFFVINTDDLTVIEQIPKVSSEPGFIDNANLYKMTAYDSRTHSLVISQVWGTLGGTVDQFLVEVFLNRASGGGELLSTIVEDISNRAGLDSSEVDVTALADTTVSGYVVSSESTYRSMIEPLQRIFFFEGFESDWIIKFADRGGASVVTIPADDLGTLKQNDPNLTLKRINDIEIPGEVFIKFLDKDRDKEQGSASARRISNPTRTQFSDSDFAFSVPIVLTATEAEQAAEKTLYTLWAERVQMQNTLPWKYLKLDPSDIATVVFNNENRRIRLKKFDVGANMAIEFKANQEDAESHLSTLAGFSGDGHTAQVIPTLSTTRLILLDSPLLVDDDSSILQFSRSYYGFGKYDSTWTSAALFRSLDSGGSYDSVSSSSVEATWGYISGLMPDPANTTTWDESATITLKVVDRADRLVSATELSVLNGANKLVVFHSDGGMEVLQFVTAVDNGDGSVTISKLLRGRRGTEDIAIISNLTNASVFVLVDTGANSFQTNLSSINVLLPYKAVSAGTSLASADTKAGTMTGQDLIPYSVSNIESVISAGDKIVTWKRRTRHHGQLLGGTGVVPLNEESELYDIEYFKPEDPDTVILTRTDLTAPTDTITNAEYSSLFNSGQTSEQIVFQNWDFQEGVFNDRPTGWTITGNGGGILTNYDVVASFGSLSGPPAGGGTWFLVEHGIDATTTGAEIEVDLLAKGYSLDTLDSLSSLGYDVYLGQPTDSADTVSLTVSFRDSLGAIISSGGTGDQVITAGVWTNFTGSIPIPTGTRSMRVRFECQNTGTGNSAGAIDSIILTLGADEVGPVGARIYQKSSIMGRGRATNIII